MKVGFVGLGKNGFGDCSQYDPGATQTQGSGIGRIFAQITADLAQPYVPRYYDPNDLNDGRI